jgi:hypothetical protein
VGCRKRVESEPIGTSKWKPSEGWSPFGQRDRWSEVLWAERSTLYSKYPVLRNDPRVARVGVVQKAWEHVHQDDQGMQGLRLDSKLRVDLKIWTLWKTVRLVLLPVYKLENGERTSDVFQLGTL